MRTTSIFQLWRRRAMVLAGTALLALPVAGQAAKDSTSGVTANGAFLFWDTSNWKTTVEPRCIIDHNNEVQYEGTKKRDVTCTARWMSGNQPDEILPAQRCISTLEAGEEDAMPISTKTIPVNPNVDKMCPPPTWEMPPGGYAGGTVTREKFYNKGACGTVPRMREYDVTVKATCSDDWSLNDCKKVDGERETYTKTYTEQVGTETLQPCQPYPDTLAFQVNYIGHHDCYDGSGGYCSIMQSAYQIESISGLEKYGITGSKSNLLSLIPSSSHNYVKAYSWGTRTADIELYHRIFNRIDSKIPEANLRAKKVVAHSTYNNVTKTHWSPAGGKMANLHDVYSWSGSFTQLAGMPASYSLHGKRFKVNVTLYLDER